eukprot:TRINITY_DN64303_c0_g1_i1.p1 TRINITY_DN64303_c0_g1~~TRINITY_DN64303_c0_g1_i1.p1  ORF type:complete len:679 (+),score=130.51 TRINITY_DN64303_c0_g1_i1:206-2038(+)
MALASVALTAARSGASRSALARALAVDVPRAGGPAGSPVVRSGASRCSRARVCAGAPALRQLRRPSTPPLLSRPCASASAAAHGAAGSSAGDPDDGSRPPLLVRTALVGATTALMTPLFPVIGFNQLVFRFVDPATRAAIHGGTSMLYFSAMTLMPNAFYYAPVLLPFAVGNGVTAASVYLAADVAAGGPGRLASFKLAFIPLAGPLLGVAIALLVPLTYPISWGLVYGGTDMFNAELYDLIFTYCYNWIMLPCLTMTGLASGLIIHAAIRPVMVGVQGIPWANLSGAVLLAVSLGLYCLYSTATRTEVVHLRDADLENARLGGWLFPTRLPCYVAETELTWVPGLDHGTGQVVSRRLPVQRLADGRRRCCRERPMLEEEPGIARSEASGKLVSKALDSRAKLYSSQRGAYFDFSGFDELDRKAIRSIEETSHVGEGIFTDAVVLVVAAAVPSSQLEAGLRELLPRLAESSFAESLRKPLNPFRSSWALYPQQTHELLGDVMVRAAQLRELLRLEAGAPAGPVAQARLEEILTASGVDLDYARRSLRALGWRSDAGARDAEATARRAADLQLMAGNRRKEQVEKVGGAMAFVAGLGLVAAGAAAALNAQR